MRNTFIILCFLLSLKSAAQSVPTFSKFYTQDSLLASSGNVIAAGDSIILMPSIYDGRSFQGYAFIKTNLAGEEAHRLVIIKRDTIFSGNFGLTVGKTLRNELVWGGEIYRRGTSVAASMLYKVRSTLDTIFIKTLTYEGCSGLLYARELSDGNYLMAGYRRVCTDPERDAAMIKTDTLGNIIWSIHTPHPHNSYYLFPSIFPGGFYISQEIQTNQNAGDSIIALRKYDNDGNLRWSIPFGVPGRDNRPGPLIATQDGGGIQVINVLDTGDVDLDHSHPAVIYKFDSAGRIVWERWLFGGNFTSAVETKSGSFVFAENLLSLPYGGLMFGLNFAGNLFKIDKNGNRIWEQRFIQGVDTNYDNYFFDVTEASDGGIVATGQALELATQMQKAWLLKVDSNGCLEGNCPQLHVGIAEMAEEDKFIIFPNPATSQFTVAVAETAYMRSHGDMTLALYDVAGREIRKQPIQDQVTTVQRGDMASGLYFWKIVDNGRVLGKGKVVFR